MTELVLDASVIIKWWRTEGEAHVDQARALRANFEAGEVSVVAPSLINLEVINAFGCKWGWPEAALIELARALKQSRFDIEDPDLESVARWIASGLTAYDACYIALAEVRGIELVTDDGGIVAAAPGIAVPLTAR